MSPRVRSEIVVYVEYGEQVWMIVFNAEGVCKIGLCPEFCREGELVPLDEWNRYREPTPGTHEHPDPWPPAILDIQDVTEVGVKLECGDALCFELPNGELVCLQE
ncbi:hypothetical protein ACGF5M_02750 [Gemmatimonadota bacterium]